jgi:hypothetical protein
MKNLLSLIEKSVLEKLLDGNFPLLNQLKLQVELCIVEKREFTGFGFYTSLSVPNNVPRKAGLDIKFGDVIASIHGLSSGAGFLLYIKDGVIDMLEGYSYDEPWPSSTDNFILKYINGDKREWADLPSVLLAHEI